MKRTATTDRHNSGFTLIELILAMAVFMVILVIAAQSFNNIYSQSARFTKSEESNIEGVIGLEVMRHDLEQMGFGLPWAFSRSDIAYEEATDAKGLTFNDKPSAIPRAFVAADGFGNYTSDYIGVKATTVGSTKASQRWTYTNLSTSSGKLLQTKNWPTNNMSSSDRVIIVRSNFNNPADDHLLIVDPSQNDIFFSTYGYLSDGGTVNPYFPQNDQQTHMIYGVDTINLRMPFNRADFFIKMPDPVTDSPLPPFCAPRTGVLYKATVNQSNGAYKKIPLMDCVADMQVVLGWDTSDEGKANIIDAYSSVDGSTSTGFDTTKIMAWLGNAKDLREHLKVVKVYILAQEGKRDQTFTSPITQMIVGKDCRAAESTDIDCGQNFTRMYNFSAAQLQYRWKLYRLIVRPKNLVSNQR